MTDGIQTVSISPAYVYTQNTTPSDVTVGKIWIDTSTIPPTTKVSDGTNYNTLSTDLTNVEKIAGTNALNILYLNAQTAKTAGVTANFKGDAFTTSGGYGSTIDAVNTTATFSTNKYYNPNATPLTLTGVQQDTTYAAGGGDRSGVKILANANCYLGNVVIQTSNTASKCYLLNASFAVLQTVSISAGNADFGYLTALTNGVTYYIAVDGNGAGYTGTYTNVPAFPYNGTNISITGGDYQNASDTRAFGIYQITTSATAPYGNKIVQTNAQTLPITPTKAMIITTNPTITGTGSINYDISTNGGTNYQTAQSSNTEISLTNAGTSLILKQNLKTGASGTASVTDWGVLYW